MGQQVAGAHRRLLIRSDAEHRHVARSAAGVHAGRSGAQQHGESSKAHAGGQGHGRRRRRRPGGKGHPEGKQGQGKGGAKRKHGGRKARAGGKGGGGKGYSELY
jgi:hypothetical protein